MRTSEPETNPKAPAHLSAFASIPSHSAWSLAQPELKASDVFWAVNSGLFHHCFHVTAVNSCSNLEQEGTQGEGVGERLEGGSSFDQRVEETGHERRHAVTEDKGDDADDVGRGGAGR
jgi:hypothetical protein